MPAVRESVSALRYRPTRVAPENGHRARLSEAASECISDFARVGPAAQVEPRVDELLAGHRSQHAVAMRRSGAVGLQLIFDVGGDWEEVRLSAKGELRPDIPPRRRNVLRSKRGLDRVTHERWREAGIERHRVIHGVENLPQRGRRGGAEAEVPTCLAELVPELRVLGIPACGLVE